MAKNCGNLGFLTRQFWHWKMMQTPCMLLITDTPCQNNVQTSLLKWDKIGLTTTDALDFLNSTWLVPTQVMLSAEQSQISSNFTVPVKKCTEIEIWWCKYGEVSTFALHLCLVGFASRNHLNLHLIATMTKSFPPAAHKSLSAHILQDLPGKNHIENNLVSQCQLLSLSKTAFESNSQTKNVIDCNACCKTND
jgi:hypothetical protein